MTKLPEAVWRSCGADGWCYVDWADHWQTMITGCLAVAAAAWAASLSRRQLRIGQDQVDTAREQIKAQLDDQMDRRSRALRATRAALPGVLSAICDHAAHVATQLAEAWETKATHREQRYPQPEERNIVIDIPPFPAALSAPLQEILINVDNAAVHDRIASIFREAQVLDARTRELTVGQMVSKDWLKHIILQAVALYVRAESLFDYARGETEQVPADLWDRIYNALRRLGIEQNIHVLAKWQQDVGAQPGVGDRDPS